MHCASLDPAWAGVAALGEAHVALLGVMCPRPPSGPHHAILPAPRQEAFCALSPERQQRGSCRRDGKGHRPRGWECRTGEVSPGLAGRRAGWARPPQPGKRSAGPDGPRAGVCRKHGGKEAFVAPGSLPATQRGHSSRAQNAFCGPSANGPAWPSLGLPVGAGPCGLQHTALSPASPWPASGGPQSAPPGGPWLPCHAAGAGAAQVAEHSLPTHACCPLPALGPGHHDFHLRTWRPRCRLSLAAALPQSLLRPPGHSSTPHTCPPVRSHDLRHLKPSLLWNPGRSVRRGPPSLSALLIKVHTHQSTPKCGVRGW